MKQLLMILLLLAGVLSSHQATAATTAYTYDDLNRLARVNYGDGSYLEYRYDPVGNFTTVTAVADTDGDGVNNGSDNCPGLFNPSQADVNGNAIGDACDTASDTDQDGLSDAVEVLTYNTSPAIPDSDNDGVNDGQEAMSGSDPLVSGNGSFNPNGDFHSGVFLDSSVAEGGNPLTTRQDLSFNGTVVGAYAVVAASDGVIGQGGAVMILPNPDHTFRVADSDFAGITANDQSVEVLADLVTGDDGLALQINGRKGSGMGDASLGGAYVFAQLHDASASLAPTMVTRLMSLLFDGSGSVEYATLAESSGGGDGGAAGYSVADDGTLYLLGGVGFVSPDGEVIMAVDTTIDPPAFDDEISLGVGVRRGANLGNGNLFGEFVVYEMGYETRSWTSSSVYTFTGAGRGFVARVADSDGQTSAPVPFAYSVTDDGKVSIDGQPLGTMSANGQYLIIADADWQDANPGLSLGFGVKSAKVLADQPGVYRGGYWYLDSSGNGLWDDAPTDRLLGKFGLSTDIPVAGDWNGDGKSDLGLYRAGSWYLDLNGNGIWDGTPTDKLFGPFGLATDIPVIGDWNGDGISELGFYRAGYWYLDMNGNGIWDGPPTDKQYKLGQATDLPVVGDWSATGVDKIGVYRQGYWYLDLNGNGIWEGTPTDKLYKLGQATDLPVVGDWSATGVDKIGVYRQGYWYLDINGNGLWEGAPADRLLGKFGQTTDKPVVGNW